MTLVPFAPWRPDIAPLNSAYTGDVNNVLLAAGSYISFPSFSPFGAALDEAPLGYLQHKTADGSIEIFAGTATKLLRFNTSTKQFDDVSKTGGYGANIDSPWDIKAFGDRIIAVNKNDDPQFFDIGSSTEFDNLPGNPPRAGKVNIWGSFVCLSDLTSNPNRNHWSGLENSGQWTPGTNNSDYQDHPDGGRVVGSTDSTNPLIFQESAIRIAYFVPGSIEVFSFRKVQDKRGAKSTKGVCSRGEFAFYADDGGFFQAYADGSVDPIGREKVDRSYFMRMSFTAIQEIIGAIDPFYSRVYWALSVSGTGYDTILIYDWELKEWSKAEVRVSGLFPAATIGYTLDSLGVVYPSLDDLPFSLDSKVWQGGAPLLAAFNTNFEIGFFSGEAMEAVITTQEMGEVAGSIRFITEVTPVVDAQEIYLSIGARMRRGDPVVWTDEFQPSSKTGIGRKRSRAKFHQISVRVPEGVGFRHAQGVDVNSHEAGIR